MPVTGHLWQPTRVTDLKTDRAEAHATPIRSCSRWGLPCRSRYRSRGGLLPHPFTLTFQAETSLAVCFLRHFPWGRPRRALPGTVFPWSPDFPPRKPCGDIGATVRPTGKPEIGRAAVVRQAAGSSASSRSSVATVDRSATPSTRDGRKWRWKAVTMAVRRSAVSA